MVPKGLWKYHFPKFLSSKPLRIFSFCICFHFSFSKKVLRDILLFFWEALPYFWIWKMIAYDPKKGERPLLQKIQKRKHNCNFFVVWSEVGIVGAFSPLFFAWLGYRNPHTLCMHERKLNGNFLLLCPSTYHPYLGEKIGSLKPWEMIPKEPKDYKVPSPKRVIWLFFY